MTKHDILLLVVGLLIFSLLPLELYEAYHPYAIRSTESRVIPNIASPSPISPSSGLLTSCGVLDQPHTTYVLQNDVEAKGTCFVLEGEGITLDCQGHKIRYSLQSPGHGILASHVHDVLVHDCFIHQPKKTSQSSGFVMLSSGGSLQNNFVVTKGSSSHALSFSSSSQISVFNNTFIVYGSESSGLSLSDSSFITLHKNTLTSLGEDSVGVDLRSSFNNTFSNNIFSTFSSGDTVTLSLVNSPSNTFVGDSLSYKALGVSLEGTTRQPTHNTFLNISLNKIISDDTDETAPDVLSQGPGLTSFINPSSSYTYVSTRGSHINVLWPVDVYTLDVEGAPVTADVDITDVYGTLVHSGVSSEGYLGPLSLLGKDISVSGETNYNLYTFTGLSEGLESTTTVNVSAPLQVFLNFSQALFTTTVPGSYTITSNPLPPMSNIISASLSTELENGVEFLVLDLPSFNTSAVGNNDIEATDYFINVISGVPANVSIKGDDDLLSGVNSIPLQNERYSVSLDDPFVFTFVKHNLTTYYKDNILATNYIGNNTIYLKFFLDAPYAQPPGVYTNNLLIRVKGSPIPFP